VLFEAYSKIEEYFQPMLQPVLEVVTDPEEDSKELFALVRTKLSPDEALRRLERFDQVWWLEASPRAECLLNIDVEYI
jgi:hypothetical protein